MKLQISNLSDNKNKYIGNNYGALSKFKFENLLKYSFARIKYFNHFEPELVFIGKDLSFFKKRYLLLDLTIDQK